MIDLSLTIQPLLKEPGIARSLQGPGLPLNPKKLRALLAEPRHTCRVGRLSHLQSKLHLCLFMTMFGLPRNRLARFEALMVLKEQGTKA